MIADEVLTFARTGEWFGSYDGKKFVRPDIMAIGKNLGMGIQPASMVISRKDIKMGPYRGISTFDLTPLTCQIIGKGIKEIKDRDLLAQSKIKGKNLLKRIKKGKMIKEVRGRGLLIGLELTDYAHPFSHKIRESLLEKGLNSELMSGRKRENKNTTIRLSPPLIVTEDDCTKAAQTINNFQEEFSF